MTGRPDTPAVLFTFSPLALLFIVPEAKTSFIPCLLEQLLLVWSACADESLCSCLVPEIKTTHLICHWGFCFTNSSTQDKYTVKPTGKSCQEQCEKRTRPFYTLQPTLGRK